MWDSKKGDIHAVDLLSDLVSQSCRVRVGEDHLGVGRGQTGIQGGDQRPSLAIARGKNQLKVRVTRDQAHQFNPGISRGPDNGDFFDCCVHGE